MNSIVWYYLSLNGACSLSARFPFIIFLSIADFHFVFYVYVNDDVNNDNVLYVNSCLNDRKMTSMAVVQSVGA